MSWRQWVSIAGLALTGCATAHLPRTSDIHGPAPTSSGSTLASVAGSPIIAADIPAATRQRLTDLDNEYAQRRFQVIWTGIEDAVASRLLQDEAARRQISVAALLQEEVDSKIGVPNEAELRDLYDANHDVIGVPFERAEASLRQQWQQDRVSQLRRGLVDRLRQGNDVQYLLTPPELPRYPIEVGDAPALGPASAPVTIVEFADFQCPYSAQARRLLQRLTEIYPADVRVVFRDFPLAQHSQAAQAAQAAQCAQEQERFWPYYDLLFENNQALEAADLKRYAAQAELNTDIFERCLASDRPKQAVAANERDGRRFGVQGTPALFVNGMRLEGVLPLPLMQAIINRELGRP